MKLLLDDNKLSYDQHFSKRPWTKCWFQNVIGKEQWEYEYERVKSNNCDTSETE